MPTYLHQIDVADNPTSGMSYAVQSGGSVVMIDGGCDGGDAELTLEYLKKITGKEIPVVDAWFITHPHLDHFFCLKGIGERHSKEIIIKKIIARFPPESFLENAEPACVNQTRLFNAAVRNFDGAEFIEPSAGDSFVFGEAKFDVLYTFADLPVLNGGKGMKINDTSTVFRLTSSGQTVLFLGDAQVDADRVLIDKYGKDLKSDVVQLAHHGLNGSTLETYRLIDPGIVLWPEELPAAELLPWMVDVDRELFSDSFNVKEVVMQGQGTRVMEMPIRPSVAPYEVKFPDEELFKKFLTPDLALHLFDSAPDVSDPADPAWENSDLFLFPTYTGSRGKKKTQLTMHRTDEGLYYRIRVSGLDRPGFSDPDSFSRYAGDCVRIHFSESRDPNFDITWSKTSRSDCFRDLRLFPAPMNCAGGAFNSIPSRFVSSGSIEPDGFCVCSFIPFSRPHEKKDVIGFHAEVNLHAYLDGFRPMKVLLNAAPYAERYRFFQGG
ncbi:MAG: MBL fold metallo-hydrolase, partial [Clostridia bacterium]|nr:MBL fold metallo-hydrolase [Clostridia bacterium]